jgi:hypothetical protein
MALLYLAESRNEHIPYDTFHQKLAFHSNDADPTQSIIHTFKGNQVRYLDVKTEKVNLRQRDKSNGVYKEVVYVRPSMEPSKSVLIRQKLKTHSLSVSVERKANISNFIQNKNGNLSTHVTNEIDSTPINMHPIVNNSLSATQ